jgi:hypothetical protein
MRTSLYLLLIAFVTLSAVVLMPRGAAEDPPPLEILSPEQGLRTNNTTLMVTGITSPNATVNITVESHDTNRSFTGPAREDGTFSVVVELYESIQKVVVTVTDAQNRSSTATRDVACDTEPPTIKIGRPPISPFYTNMTNYTIVVENHCECMIWVSIGGGVEMYTSAYANRTVDLVEGENRIEIRARDMLWNEVVVWVVLLVDTMPPDLGLLWQGDEVLTNRSVIALRGDVGGATSVEVELNGMKHQATLTQLAPATTAQWACELDLGHSDGRWRATVRASDALGNVAERSMEIVLDTTPPVIILYHVNATRVPRVEIDGQTDEGIDTVRINSQDFAVVNGLFSVVQPLKHGWNTVFFHAVDGAGNHATAMARVFCSERPPALAVQAPERLGGDRVRIRGSTDRYVLNVTVGTMEFPVVNGSFDVIVNLTRGENRFTVSVEDPAGATSDERVDVRNGTPGQGVVASAVALVATALLLGGRRVAGRERRGNPPRPW